MTRKQALLRSIEVLVNSQINTEEKCDLTQKLNECISELPFSKWSEAAIFDACDQFILDQGRNIRTTDFSRAELPSHPTIQNRFKMTAMEFRNKYYPYQNNNSARSPFWQKQADEWKKLFIDDFHRVKPMSSSLYNKNRREGLPTWITVARMLDVYCWSELLLRCKLESYKKNVSRLNSNYYSLSTMSKSQCELQKLCQIENENS